MCDSCGCGHPGEKATIRVPGEELTGRQDNQHEHEHEHEHEHYHSHPHKYNPNGEHHYQDHDDYHKRTISVETDILYANNLIAERNRGLFEAKNITAINFMSSPGAGKTALLERTIMELKDAVKFFVIEGDQQTMNDAERIKITGVPVVQVNTGNGCHLDAEMIRRAVKKLSPDDDSIIMIENVGNLVCPSLFDLGEESRVVIMSVTEGEDKPLKYPNMFQSASLCIINKTDLLPYLDYNISKAIEYTHQVNVKLQLLKLSVKTGEGMDEWYEWLQEHRV